MSRRMLQHRYPKGKPAEDNQAAATTSLPTPAADVMPQQWDGAFQQPALQYPMDLQQPPPPQEGWSSVPTSAAVHYGGPVSGEGYWNCHQPLPSEEAVTGGGPAVQQPWSSWPPEGAMAPPPTGVGGGTPYLGQQQYPGAWPPEWQWQQGGAVPEAEGWSAPPGGIHWQQQQQQQQQQQEGDPVGHPSVPLAEALHDGLQEASVEDVPPAVCDSQDSQGLVELQQQQQHSEALGGDDGTVSMFFQDGEHHPGGVVVDGREEELSTSTGFVVDAAAHGTGPPPGSDEPVNQEVLPLAAAEPREEVAPEEGPPECSSGAPAPSKKAVIRARQGGAFKPPVRQGSTTDTALLQQQQQQQNGGPPENLELLPPDGRPSLRRTGVAPLSPAGGPVDTVGAGLTLLDAPDMRPLVTLAPAAPPIDRPSSRTGEATGRPVTSEEEEAVGDPALPLLRQSPLGREGEAARGSNVVATRAQAATVLASSPLLSEDSALPERTEPSGSIDRPQPVPTATRAAGEELESSPLPVVRSSATSSHPLPQHEPPTSMGGKHEGPSDKGEPPHTRQEEPKKGNARDYREEHGKHARDYREPRESRSARARGSDDEAGKGSRDDFNGRQPAKGREDPEHKRDRHYDRPDDRRAAGKGDPEEYRKGAGRSGATEDRKRRDDYDWRDDYYEDRRGERREEFRDDYRKGERKSERHAGRREPLRGHESDDEWRERRSDRRGDRYGGGRHDYRHDERHSDRYSDWARPSSRVSQDGRGDRRRQDCRPASRHSESDSSSPDSRKGYAPGLRQKRPGSAGGHNYSAYQRDYYNYYHRYGIAAGAVYGIPPGSGFGYGYHDELYRTNPAYKQQVDAYYGRLGGQPAHLTERHSVHSGRSSARDESFASNTEDDCDPSILDTESTRLEHVVPEPEEVKKFSRPHPLARFCGANGLLKLVPAVNSGSLPPPIELHSLKHLFQKEPQFHQLQAFPGPLIRSHTHKNDVIQFCTQKIESFSADPNLPDRSSHILLWELLVLMLRQNGFVSGSDIAELLLRGRGALDPPSAPVMTSPEGADDSPSPDEGIVVTDRTQLAATGSSRVLAKFREFLLFGHKKDALDWAVKCGLWGHALSLAAKMDTRTYAGIMTCFTNALAINDPLQTLYQHLSGRQPAAVTCIADSKWGDWRPHLAMILSNPSSRPEVDARSITTLGDVLASRGCLPAAHFCYLMSQVEFGSYACKAAKLVLLGSNHQTLPFEEFASNEAIQCTEIYEYSQSLASPDYMLPHLQVYKFLHAMRLAEYGLAQKALHYCEVLADAMVRQQQGGGAVAAQLAVQTYELAERLKYHDPHFSQGQGELEELGDPAWLHTFAQLLALLRPQYGLEGHDVQQPVVAEAASFLGGQQQSFASSVGFVAPTSSPDSTFLVGNSTYLDACGDSAQVVAAPDKWNPPRVMSSTPFTTSSAEVAGWNSQQAPSAPAAAAAAAAAAATATEGSSSFQSSPAVESMANGMPPQAPSSPPASGQASSFDYYKASTYSHRRTSRERVSSVSSSTDTRRDSVDSAGLTSSAATESRGAKPAAKQPPVAGKSWLGGIFGKLLPKGPNQMILPDDKDPDIVWDEEKKCWVDKNAPPGELENRMAAPPSDSLLAAKPSPVSNKCGENRFQLNKQRSLRKHYVDVLNPGSSKASGDLPPVAAPFSEQAPPQFFVPQPTVGAEPTPSYDFVSSVPPPLEHATGPPKGQQQPGGEPLAAAPPVMYDPAEFTARPGDGHEGAGYYGRRWSQAAYPT